MHITEFRKILRGFMPEILSEFTSICIAVGNLFLFQKTMKLLPVTSDDLDLYISMFCNEQHMAELGGVQPVEKVPSMLEKQISYATSDKGWLFKVVPEEEDLPADGSLTLEDISKGVGTVNVWEGEWNNAPATEMGWGIAPSFQGHKFATKAIKLVLEKAVESGRWGTIHVFTSTTNVPSNALCKSCGFVYQGEEKIDYDGRELFTTHYIYETQR